MAVLDQITTITQAVIGDPNLNLIEFDHALLDVLWRKRKVFDQTGHLFEWAIRYTRQPGSAFEYYDVLTNSAPEQFQKGSVTLRQREVAIVISSQELLETIRMDADMLVNKTRNLGDIGGDRINTLVNLLKAKLVTAPNDMRAYLANDLWGDGTGSGGKALDGVRNIILNNTSAYAGLAAAALGTDAAGNNLWASIVNGTAGNTDTFQLSDVRTDMSSIANGRAYQKDQFYVIVTPSILHGLELVLEASAIHNTGTAAELGYETITWHNLTFMADPDAISDAAVYVDTSAFRLFYDPIWDMKFSSWIKPDNQEAISCRLLFRGQFVCEDRRRQGMRQGIALA